MPSIFKTVLLILLLTGLLPATGTQFLAVPSSAIELALGGQVALPNAAGTNPAVVPEIGAGPQVDFCYGDWFTGVAVSTLNARFRLNSDVGSVRLRYLGLDDLPYRDERPSDDPLANYAAYSLALEGGWSRAFGGSRVGVTMRLLQIQLHTAGASGMAFDLGGTRSVGKNLTIGAALLNLGRMNVMVQEIPQLPLRLLVGAGYRFDHPLVPTSIGLTGEWSTLVNGPIFRVGSRSTWDRLTVSLGTEIASAVVMASGGIGLQVGRFGINYGIRFGSQQLGLPQMLDLSVNLP
ncbi:MAG: hypothetical protein ABIA75_06975 [Candidatus Neomarinimicrobiota bacterium]